MPGTVKSGLLSDADRSHKCDCQDKVCWMRHLLLDKGHFITGGITQVIGGGTPSSGKSEYYENGEIPWISPADLSNYRDIYISKGAKNITKLGLEKSSARLLPKNTICLSSRAPIGYVAIAANELTTNQGFKSFLPSPVYVPQYLYWYLKGNTELLTSRASGTTFLELSGSKAAQIEFPLPPLAEQHRIVSRIESLFAKLDEAKEKAQAVVDGFEDRKAAILHKAFTGELTADWRRNNKHNSVEFYREIQHKLSKSKKKKAKKVQNDFTCVFQKRIPSEWVLVDLDSISRLITDGEHKTPNRVDSFCGFYLLSARNILNDSLKLDDVDYVDSDEYEVISKRCNPKKGDILLSCSGSVGRCCVVNDTNHYCMVRSAAMISQEGCNSRYLMYMIQSDAVQEQIKSLSKQTAQANLFLGAIASLVIPLPSKEEQDKMTLILDDLMKKNCQANETAEQVIVQINEMKKSILARAFRGELGTNDPADESAEELLKRIL